MSVSLVRSWGRTSGRSEGENMLLLPAWRGMTDLATTLSGLPVPENTQRLASGNLPDILKTSNISDCDPRFSSLLSG